MGLNVKNLRALSVIVTALKKPLWKQHEENYGEPTVYLDNHPFISDYDDFVNFYGWGSDDIYPFLYTFLSQNLRSEEIILRFWLCPLEHNEKQHQIYGEIESEMGSAIVAGMTNYSGSGGKAYEELREVFEFLGEIYNIQVEYNEVEPGYYIQVENEINKCWREQHD